MSRIVGKRISRSQLEKMADFLEKYPQLSKGSSSSEKSVHHGYKNKLWRELANILNVEPLGAKKSSLKWRKCLRDYKCYVKKKYLHYLADSSNLSPLTYLDVRYLAMMGYVVDMDSVEFSNKDNEQTHLQLEESTVSHVTDFSTVPKHKELEQKFYHAPEIITILPSNYLAPTGAHMSNTEHSGVTEDAHENVERLSNKEQCRPTIENPQNVERPKNNELSNVERTQNNEPPNVETSEENEPSIEEFTNNEKSASNPKASPKKKTSLATRGVKTKNASAVALHAIAKELGVKNELTKRKIELEKEKLQLEKRKIEAFELFAKRLCRKLDKI